MSLLEPVKRPPALIAVDVKDDEAP